MSEGLGGIDERNTRKGSREYQGASIPYTVRQFS